MKEFETINDILDFAIDQEEQAVDFYNEMADNARSDDMKRIFEEFAREEMAHKAKLINVKKTGLYTSEVETVQDLKIADYVVVSKKTISQLTYEDALVLAMKKEKSAFKLYSNLAERAPNAEVKELFQALALEESKHKLSFELEYDEFVLKEN